MTKKATVVISLLVLALGAAGRSGSAGDGEPFYTMIKIDSSINPGVLSTIRWAQKRSKTLQADALVIQLDTPGGLLSTTRDIVNSISRSEVPIVVYVGPVGASATSAGAFILLASHYAVMNSGTNVGASSPVSSQGKDIEGTMGKKIMNDTKAFIRSIANKRGRNADISAKFVTEALSLTAKKAKADNIIDQVVSSKDGLVDEIRGKTMMFKDDEVTLVGESIRDLNPPLSARFLTLVAEPQVAYLLTSLGSVGIYLELLSPGLLFPGITGVICLILGLMAVQTLPVQVGFLALLLFGIALIIAEIFVSGFGMLGIGGSIAFILGSLNLFDDPGGLESYRNLAWTVSVSLAVAMLLLMMVVTGLVRRRTRGPLGTEGEALAAFQNSHGHIKVNGEIHAAYSAWSVAKGERVVVESKSEDGRLRVRPSREVNRKS